MSKLFSIGGCADLDAVLRGAQTLYYVAKAGFAGAMEVLLNRKPSIRLLHVRVDEGTGGVTPSYPRMALSVLR